MSAIDNIHDKSIKKAFEHKQMALEFFDQHLPEEVKKIVDITKLEPCKESFIEEDGLSAKYSDILFEAKLKDGELGYIYH
jgi:predicted transposase YdaD